MENRFSKCAFFRVNANRKIGSGHFIRCRLLAEKLERKGIKAFFIYNELPENYLKEVKDKGFGVFEIENVVNETEKLIGIIKKANCEKSILITDSDKKIFYSKEFQLRVRENNIVLMTITFYADTHFYSDFILNQNIMAPSLEYSTEPYTEKLLGTRFVVLDPRYSEIAVQNENWESKNNVVLISFGGVDKPDRTGFVYEALQEFSGVIDKIIVVTGALYQNQNNLEKLISQSKIDTELYRNTNRMPFLMAESKYAFTSGGLTAWELGVTKTLNIIIAESEREFLSGKFLGENGYCYFLGKINEVSVDKLKESFNVILSNANNNKIMVEKLFAEIDPYGTEKVVEKIVQKLN